MDDDLDDVSAPRCPNCLTTCQAAGSVKHPFWVCPQCRTAVLAH